MDVDSDMDYYKAFPKRRQEVKQSLLENPSRFQAISQREDRSDLSPDVMKAQSCGRFLMHHRGCILLKGAGDLAIMKELLAYVRPATVIELGVYAGGNTIWLADTTKIEGIDCNVYAMDIDLSFIEDKVKQIKPDNVTFLQGDSNKIAETFSCDFLKKCPHPWIVIDDAHVNICGVMEHFVQYMNPGDYFVIEDTNPDMPKQVGMGGAYGEFITYGPVCLNPLKKFLSEHEKECAVDSYFTDFFGYNNSSNWHGYVRRM